jgi:hypothetical protein
MSSYRRMLELVDAATQDAVRGAQVDEPLLAEARDEVRVALTRTDRGSAPLDLSRLGPRRAYVQLRLHQEGPFFLDCFVAYRDEDGRPVTHQFEFSDTIDLLSLPRGIDNCVTALASGLEELSTLQPYVNSIVVRTSPALYGLPWHEALLRNGFESVSYVHRLNSLATSSPAIPDRAQALVRGFEGSGNSRLPAVSAELAIVSSLYQTVSPGPDSAPNVVHLSGHAVTGGSPYSVAIHDQPDRSLSSARVVLDWDLIGTSVVVLSACSTGTAHIAIDQILEVIPLDIAFISAGAAAVVSTSAPVDDDIAMAFASAFHFEVTSGAGVWNAYATARRVARGDDPGEPLRTWLDSQWPRWNVGLKQGLARAPEDWQLFRLVGRYW